MSSLRYILASLWHYRRVQLAVLAGVLVATAVITGALLVGDSVRGSLRDLALDRLGKIETLLVAEQPFRSELSRQLESVTDSAPLLIVEGALSVRRDRISQNATRLSIIGYTSDFWNFDQSESSSKNTQQGVWLTPSLAHELDVAVGDSVLLRIPRISSLPADSTLGEKSDTTQSSRIKVAGILPDQGLARFSLRPSQKAPRTVFVPLEKLQEMLELPDRINAVALGSAELGSLENALKPTLDDFHVRAEDLNSGAISITAEQLVLPKAIVDDVQKSFPQITLQPVITYLANTLQLEERKIPYSTVSGVTSLPPLGPLLDAEGQPIVLEENEIVLNDWAATDLKAKIGDQITLTYYEPETTHGQLREAPPVELTLRAIIPLADQDGNATLAQDPSLTPTLPGVTDQRSISNWDLPFELVEEIRQEDEDYWDEYSTTPKAFVAYNLAEKLWKSRWGTDSALRIPASANLGAADVVKQVQPSLAENGMIFLPIREQGLAASQGTTPFEGLFIGFSFFLMISAIFLIALLFRLGIEERASEVGLLSSVGTPLKNLQMLWLGEATVIVLLGALLGCAAGIGYARLMIYGLTTWWVAATGTPFLELHITTMSLAIGFVIGASVGLLTIAWSLRKLLRLPARQLLTGNCTPQQPAKTKARKRRSARLPLAMLLTAFGLGLFAMELQGEAQAGAFFGTGALVLTALLILLSGSLQERQKETPQALSLRGLAARNARRNPSRTLLSVALTAVASFLIAALSAFRLAPTEEGTGGFDWMATADIPIHFDLNDTSGREELGFSSRDQKSLEGVEVFSFRVQAGEDASCLNLYQTSRPQVLGVPQDFYTENKFTWSSLADQEFSDHPWELLDRTLGKDSAGRDIVPVVIDKNTAAYSLHLTGVGSQLSIRDSSETEVTLQVVGLLSGSILQGNLLVSEAQFLKTYPDSSGYQFFLTRSQPNGVASQEVAAILETALEDYGVDLVSSQEQLAGFLAVQNTYLSTFQSLGGLGLLLGTIGLAVAQMRSVLERRAELALLRCIGFRRSRLSELVFGENGVLLMTGLGIGCTAALVTVLPHWLVQTAGVPWGTLLVLLILILGSGLIAGTLAVRSALRAPLLPSLRGD